MNYSSDVAWRLMRANQQFANLMLPAMGLLGALMGVGVLGNALVLYVYRARLKRNTTRSFVLALAVSDLLSCTVALPGELIDMLHNFTFGASPACTLVRSINSFSAFASGMILFVVAVDRYKKICCPLGRQVSTHGANLIILVCFGVSLLLSLPAVALYGKKTVAVGDGSVNGSDCSTQDKYQGTIWPIMYNSLQFCVFMVGALGLTVLYSLIGRRIWRHRRFESKDTSVKPSAKNSISGTESSPNSTEAASSPTYIYTNSRGAPRFFNEPQDDCSAVKEKHIFISRNISRICTCPASPEAEPPCLRWPINDKDFTKPNTNKHCDRPRKSSTGRFTRISIFGFGSDDKDAVTLPRCPAHPQHGAGRRGRSGEPARGRSRRTVDRRASTVSGAARREFNARRTTLMLFVITVVYIVSFLPHLVLMATKALDKNSLSGTGGVTELVHNILIRSYFINSVANPIVYGLCCQKFRTEIVKLLTCKSCR